VGVTPTYNFPYPELGDSPNGPVQIQALAQAVEDQLEVTDATVGTHTGQISTLNTNVTNITRRAKTADAGINQTATSGVVALNAATVTFTTPVVNTQVTIRGHFDVESTGSTDVFVGDCIIDGVTVPAGEAHWKATGRGTVMQEWIVTLATAASHTIALRITKQNTSDTVTVYATHSRIVVEGNGIV
jgi:hypothetical protein